MATTLRDFIAKRETEIKEQQKALKAEMRELLVAKSALEGQEPAAAATQSSGPTIKDMARAVLSSAKDGLTSAEILSGIKAEFDKDIDRTSLSPQLSRMKADGEVMLMGESWFTKQNHVEWTARIFDASDLLDDEPASQPASEEDFDDIPF